MAEHYDRTVLPTRLAKPKDKGKIECAVLIAERWIIARLRNREFFDLMAFNAQIGHLLEVLNGKTMRHVGR
ncbi:transposase [Novosphingobium sp. Rr 2-17]|nr:transposase [Novosphingobium sp. Rr 2-17]